MSSRDHEFFRATHTFIHKWNAPCLCLPSRSWSSFADCGPSTTTVRKWSCISRWYTRLKTVIHPSANPARWWLNVWFCSYVGHAIVLNQMLIINISVWIIDRLLLFFLFNVIILCCFIMVFHWYVFCRLKELEEQYAKEKAATERQFEKQRQVCFWLFVVNALLTFTWFC